MNQNLFLEIVSSVANLPSTLPIIEYQETCFQLQSFQVHKLTPERALQTYNRIQKKYEAEKNIDEYVEVWRQSQKRLYAWFLTYYTYLNRDHNGIKLDINFTLLSQAFFLKKPEFLEFHFLALLKNNQKICWDAESDKALLEAFELYGTKWNEVSRHLHSLDKENVFRSPKHCRQRWMNHLDGTKIRGNWTHQEDLAIFQYVMENEGKKWSKLVNVLKDRRTEHSIKNRFNAMITKHRKYKLEKVSKVAARVLLLLRAKIENPSNIVSAEELPLQQDHMNSPQSPLSSEEIQPNEQIDEVDDQRKSQEQPIIDIQQEPLLKLQMSPLQQHLQKLEANDKVAEPIDNVVSQGPNQPSSCVVSDNERHYPFQTYSYEMEMCNYASHVYQFQKSQYLFYQQMMTLTPMPTADTNRITRQSRIMHERKRNKQAKPQPDSHFQ